MANNREISQFAGLVTVNDTTNNVTIGATMNVGTGITFNSGGSADFNIIKSSSIGVDLGSGTPTEAIHVGAGGSIALFNASNTRRLGLYNDANNANIESDVDPIRIATNYTGGTTYIRMDTAGTERLRLDNTGELRFGGIPVSAPGASLSTDGVLAVDFVACGAGNSDVKLRYDTGNGAGLPRYREFVASGFAVPVTGTTRTWELFQAVNVPSQYARIAGEILIVCCRHGGAQNRCFVRYGIAVNRTGGAFAGIVELIDDYKVGMTPTVTNDGDYIKMSIAGGNAANNGQAMVMFRGYVEDSLSDIRCVFAPENYVDT